MSTQGHGRTVNISSGGILFKTDDELAVGGRIELLVKLGLADDTDTYVTLFAQGVTVRSDGGGTAVSVKKHRLRPLPADDFKLR